MSLRSYDHCASQHGFYALTCIREHGHDGRCSSRAQRGLLHSIVYYEWFADEGGEFVSHAGEQRIYPDNARKVVDAP